jgi:F0F1-type ATP synthase membrane subunit b/b'
MWIIATELLIVCLVGVVLPADAAGKATLKEQFGQEMKQVREGSTSRIRNQAAEDLALMAGKMKPDEIDDRAVTDLISLLDL